MTIQKFPTMLYRGGDTAAEHRIAVDAEAEAVLRAEGFLGPGEHAGKPEKPAKADTGKPEKDA